MKTEKNSFRLDIKSIVKRGHYLYFLYFYLYSRIVDYSISKRDMNGTIFNSNKGIYAVQCISYPYLRELMKYLDYDENDVFVDVGCAWGRLIGYLDRKTKISKFIGIEINHEVAESAKRIFRKNDKVLIIDGDAIEKFPMDGTIFYLFNPFDEEYMDRFLSKAEKTIDHPIRLLYLYPTCEAVVKDHPMWNQLRTEYLKPRHLGELMLCEYQFIPDV